MAHVSPWFSPTIDADSRMASKKDDCDPTVQTLHYNMFKTEYETSVRNIEMCKDKADHIYEDVRRQWEEPSTDIQTCLENYDKVLTDLSQMADKLRKFNIQLELDAIHKFNETPNERFTYPLPKCLEYDIGYESECVITYIKDAKNKLFYITETGENSNTEQIVSKMQRYFQDNPKEFERTPRNGEVFGLHLEGYMFRAVKENGKSDKFSNCKAYLLDVGEIVTINECVQMYVLPSDYQKLPAQAVLCKLEELNVNDISPSEYLGKSLYVRHRFRIVDKDRTMLFVNLHADTNPFRNKVMTDSDSNAKNEKPVPQLTNPFKRSSNQGSDYQGTLNSNNALNGNTMNGFGYSRNNELTKTVNFNNRFDMNYMGRVLNETLQNRKASVYYKPPTAFVEGRAAGVRKSLCNRVGPTDESAPPAEATVIPNPESLIGELLSMGIGAPAPAAPAVPASNIDLLGGGLDVLLGGPPKPAVAASSGTAGLLGDIFGLTAPVTTMVQIPKIIWLSAEKGIYKNCYLTPHNKTFHNGEQPFRCNRCGKRFSNVLTFDTHYAKHSALQKPHQCQFCPKQFHHKTDLRRYIDSHTGRKAYVCETCSKGFTRRDHLRKHGDTHKPKPPKPLKIRTVKVEG